MQYDPLCYNSSKGRERCLSLQSKESLKTANPPANDISLPENTRVYVVVPELQVSSALRIRTPRLAHPEQWKDFRKQIVEVSRDASL